MKDDNTPTITSRRRAPTPHQRLRLEKAQKLKAMGTLTKKKRLDAKTQKSQQQDGETDPAKMVSVAPRPPKLKKDTLSQPSKPPARFRKRQINKSWLPTHVWHAKRARMTEPMDPLWRFAIPLTPTEKCFRTTHRAASGRGCVAWDMSYVGTIGVEGVERSLIGLLRAIGVEEGMLTGKGGAKWRRGTRGWEGWIRERDGERWWIAPVGVVWCVGEEDSEGGDGIEQKKSKRKLLLRVHPSAFLQVWNEVLKVAKIQRPQAMVEDLRFEIGSIEITGPGTTEALIGALHPAPGTGLAIKESTATATTQTTTTRITATTREATTSAPREEDDWTDIPSPSQVFPQLSSITNPSSLPQNALLAFNIKDPRLTHPPRTIKPIPTDDDAFLSLLSNWPPDQTTPPASIFDRTARLTASRLLASQKAINRRKAAADPGVFPSPLPTDPKIPIMLLPSRSSSSGAAGHKSQGSWTLLLPWSCVLPVWYSLMHYPLSTGGNPRFGGLQEKRQIAFEQQVPWFPGDFPGTRAGWEWEIKEREKARRDWERRPKGKRCEWESLDLGTGKKGEVGVGWGCDWERLFTSPPATETKESAKEPSQAAAGIEKKNAAAQAEKAPAVNSSQKTAIQQHGQEKRAAAPTEQPPLATPLSIHHFPSATLTQNSPPTIPPTALTQVHLILLTTGHPSRNARIYRLPNQSTSPSLRARWLALLPGQAEVSIKGQGKASSNEAQWRVNNRRPAPLPKDAPQHEKTRQLAKQLIAPPPSLSGASENHGGPPLFKAGDTEYPPVPGEDDLVGFVTSANFQLGEGRCEAIGGIAAARVFGNRDGEGEGEALGGGRAAGRADGGRRGQGGRASKPDSRLCIVRDAGQSVGRLARWTFI